MFSFSKIALAMFSCVANFTWYLPNCWILFGKGQGGCDSLHGLVGWDSLDQQINRQF